MATPEGWHGWDDYAAYYDWENARTFGRRDVAFWRRLVGGAQPPALELGCGTGRVLVPIARAGMAATGIDRSASMLGHAVRRARRLSPTTRPTVVRGDIRALPFPSDAFGVVIAAYGLLQSLLTDRDLDAVLADTARVVRRGGLVGIDLVPDLKHWEEYTRKVRLRGPSRRGGRVRLVETVRQLPRRGITIFDEEFIERRGRREERRAFSLTFRTVAVEDLVGRLGCVGLKVESMLGDYSGGPWTPGSDAWVIVARKGAGLKAQGSRLRA